MSDGLRSRPYAIARDLAIAAKNVAAKLRLGVAEGDWEDGVFALSVDLRRRQRSEVRMP